MLLGYSEQKGSIGDRFRAKRFKFFESCIAQLEFPIRILDVGGTVSFWANRHYLNKNGIHITLLNLEQQEANADNLLSVSGDATNLSSYEDNEFDLVFSNSVIEHLYTFENQKKMALECQRVGRYHFIQTPNKYFFMEPHYQFPFFDQLPKKVSFWILTKTNLSLGQKWKPEDAKMTLKEIRLLSKKEFQSLFAGSNLYTERLLLFSKSFILHNFNTNL